MNSAAPAPMPPPAPSPPDPPIALTFWMVRFCRVMFPFSAKKPRKKFDPSTEICTPLPPELLPSNTSVLAALRFKMGSIDRIWMVSEPEGRAKVRL